MKEIKMKNNITTISKKCPGCGEVIVPSKVHKDNGWDSLQKLLSKLDIDGVSGNEAMMEGLYCSSECREKNDK